MAPAAVTGSMGPGLPTNTQHKSVTAGSYYAQLEVSRDASAQEINKAFRKLALKHHPDKHDGAEEAVLAFRAVAEAYEVLSNPAHRALYDQYEETGLKDGVPDGRGGLIGGTYRFSGDPQRIFETFFGSSSPFGDLYGALSDPASATPDTAEPAFYGELTSLAKPVSATQPRPVTRTVPVTLGQLYRGDLLTLPHSRKKLNGDGVTTTAVDEELRLQIQPGWASGYKVVFPKAGDEGPAIVPADIVYTLQEADVTPAGHVGFRRQGHDLVYTAHISLTDALCGSIMQIQTLDGRTLSIGLTEVIRPGYTKLVPGEGMPIPQPTAGAGAAAGKGGAEASAAKGDLRIEFVIVFPERLTPKQRQAVRAVKM